MLSELRDFTRTRLGGLVVIERESCDVGAVVQNAVDELVPVYPSRSIRVECRGNLVASVDEKLIAQVGSNFVANALQHGTSDTGVTVIATGDDESVTIQDHNTGPVISPSRLKTLFDPLMSSPRAADEARLGLGLYIAQQIVRGHHGSIDVESSAATGTRFTVRLPRRVPTCSRRLML